MVNANVTRSIEENVDKKMDDNIKRIFKIKFNKSLAFTGIFKPLYLKTPVDIGSFREP